MDIKFLKTMFVRTMNIMVILMVAISLAGFGLQNMHGSARADSLAWRDDFNGTLADGWYWGNENPGNWNMTGQPGFVRIHTSAYPTGGENLLMKPVVEGDFSIETRVLFEPDTNFQFAGLVIYQDENNFLQFGRAFCDIEEQCAGNGIYFDYVDVAGEHMIDGNFATPVDNPAEAYLRLERRGDRVLAFYSYEGITWFEIGTHWLRPGFQVNSVGLAASQDFYSGSSIPADFDYFELTEGWGFLPEGYHDYDSGDVPSNACNAGGWAADPDNRAADLAIEVNIDGTSLPDWVYASEYREDLDHAGVCVDGNCSFSTSLWGIISAYEPHSVVVYAQDVPSGDWVQLSSSPKTLTCRTYDIYAFDPLTGITKQITNLRDADEYDPTWSPNGKMIAHDVVTPDSHGIYVTDIKTGVSTALAGAEDGGNDASWSPNGKWIAFDRRWVGQPDLYIVPATGGAQILARSDAVRADWAPNSKRLVFQQPSDESIRTAAVGAGIGDETLIAARGSSPAWSPDGNWIAYESNGDIWKVPVNILGKVLGDPIQVTNPNPWPVGAPTWSIDSQTIMFDTGLSGDWDLWSVPAAGGMATWLTGAPEFGDYGPENARNSSNIAYAGSSPAGQASRTWVAAFTYDLPARYWTEGSHTYRFETAGNDNTVDRSFDVLNNERLYDGTVLLRPGGIRARIGEECFLIGAINPVQPSQFHVGWTADGTYQEALSLYENLMARVAWDGGEPVDLVRHEIFPFTSSLDWGGYVCSFTAGPPAMNLRVNYGHDWVESFYEAGHEVVVSLTESDGIQPMQDVGVGYFGSDGHWVANAFREPYP